nr:heterokaryon incompatibility protein 6, or allele [Quercus suber]
MAFPYQPLGSNEIRLLRPLPQSSPSDLHFEILHVPLHLSPSYAALSYTWGPPGDTHEMRLNGHQFRIRQNLWEALRQTRISKLTSKYLWVDAVCINQGNEDDALCERSIQITLMKQIYEQAAQILVWLGTAENAVNNQLAFSMMSRFEKLSRNVMSKSRPYRPWWLLPSKPNTGGKDLAALALLVGASKDKKVFDVPGSETHRGWQGIISLWKKPWWTRTWVFQEATIPERATTFVLSGVYTLPFSSKVRFMCGDRSTDWPTLSATSSVAASLASNPSIDAAFLANAYKSFFQIWDLRRQRAHRLQISFLDLVQTFRHTGCADPRDKVYAPLCLAADDVRHNIIPDYLNKSVLDVYLDVVRYYLQKPGHELDFLGYAHFNPDERTVETPQGRKSILPSWVPNFAANADMVPIPKALHIAEDANRKNMLFIDTRGIPDGRDKLVPPYRPIGDFTSRSFIEGRQLHVGGVMIDKLKDIIVNDGPDLEQIRAVGMQKGRQWAFEANHKYFTGESFENAINRTTVLDLVWSEEIKPTERGNMLDLTFLRRPRSELSIEEYQQQLNMRIAQRQTSALRNLGRTYQLFLAMIPDTAVVGDTIWALAGGQALYVMRRPNADTEQYQYVGECYVHGLMDGDIARRLHIGELNMRDISLV